jgi:hypothetical protein
VLAAAAVVVLPWAARVLPWRVLLPACWLLSATWAVLLAFWDGHRSLGSVFERSTEYLAVLPAVGDDPLSFLRGFPEHVAARDYPVHVNGHPPLMVLVFWAWARVGLDGPGWAAALVIAAGASAGVAVAVTLRSLGDGRSARTALPFLVLGPFAITVATSADAFFLAAGAWAAAAIAAGVRRRSPPLLAAGGLLTGSLPYLNYGLLPLGAVLAVVLVLAHRAAPQVLRGRRLLALVAGALLVPVLMTVGGFWWPSGVAATHEAWRLGGGDDRPYAYSFLADFAVLSVLVGPATLVAAARRPARAPALLAAAALTAVTVLAVSGVTRLEVERIWLPFAPWMVAVTAGLGGSPRGWLAANAGCALAFQAVLLDGW